MSRSCFYFRKYTFVKEFSSQFFLYLSTITKTQVSTIKSNIDIMHIMFIAKNYKYRPNMSLSSRSLSAPW